MRKSLLFVWACMGLVCLMSACKTSVKSKEWKLVWVEDFDQKNSFDESVWTKIPRGTSDWNNYMSYYDSCYAMQDGNLILRGIANHTQKMILPLSDRWCIYQRKETVYGRKSRSMCQIASR